MFFFLFLIKKNQSKSYMILSDWLQTDILMKSSCLDNFNFNFSFLGDCFTDYM